MRHSPLVILVLLAGAAAGCAHARPHECPCPPEATAFSWVTCSWLQRIETPAEAAAAHTVNGVPFGEVHDEWVSLLSQMQPGDALWYYSGSHDCPPGSKCFRPGEDGYLLLRGCSAVKRLSIAYTYTR